MKTFTLPILLAASLLALSSPVNASTVLVNGNFSTEANLFTTSNGYAKTPAAQALGSNSNPISIPDWTNTNAGGNGYYGINGSDNNISTFGPASMSIFDQSDLTHATSLGTVSDYAFLQNFAPYSEALSQSLTFDADTKYTITLAAALRSSNDSHLGQPTLTIYDGAGIALDDVTLVADASAFTLNTYTFTTGAVAGSGYITIGNGFPDTGGGTDSTVDFSDIAINGVPVGSVPEPSTVAMIAFGLGILAATIRRRACF